jgi:predicted translin family RNA/ssDNA-binding protein
MENFNLLEQAAKVEQAAKDGNYQLANELTLNSVESLKQAIKNNPQDAEKYLSQIEQGVDLLNSQVMAVI